VKIFVTGTRGVPDIPGGVEQHCQQLYPYISSAGHEVHISRRTRYVKNNEITSHWKDIILHDIYAPESKALEAIVHTFLSIIKARLLNVDLVHIHAIGPALLVPLARLIGLKVVFTNHGPDYDRQKWGRFSRAMLKLGEYLGGKYSNSNIVISRVIQDIVQRRCNTSSHLIYNGVSEVKTISNKDYLKLINVIPKRYILAVARFVPEKGLHDLIDAYARTDSGYDLVIAGDADHEDEYSKSLKKKALSCGVKLTGYITGDDLRQIYSNAALFVLPSYHEGLPIALLEALSYGLNVLVSDIPANLEVKLENRHYFKCGDVTGLCRALNALLQEGTEELYHRNIREMLRINYNWEEIAKKTIDVYKTTIKTRI
jgi:starch synthase